MGYLSVCLKTIVATSSVFLFFGCDSKEQKKSENVTVNQPVVASSNNTAVIPVTAEPKVSTPSATVSGKGIFEAQCKSCHGVDGKRQALGKSIPIAGLKTVEADLKSYRAGTLNKNGMGPVMKGNAAKLSDDDIKAVAEYVASMK